MPKAVQTHHFLFDHSSFLAALLSTMLLFAS